MSDWYERVASERMAVDASFNARLSESPLTNQQWGLVMTALTFDIENPDDPERARIVPDTDAVEDVLPAVREAGGQLGAGGAGGGASNRGESIGLLGRLKSALGVGDGTDGLEDAIERLAAEYAQRLQERLEKEGRWTEVCRRAA